MSLPTHVTFNLGDLAMVAASLDGPNETMAKTERLGRISRSASRYRAPVEVAREIATLIEGCPAHWSTDCGPEESRAVRNAARKIREAIAKAGNG